VLLADGAPAPAKQGVRRDEARDAREYATPEGLRTNREPPPLSVGQPEASATELLAQNPVLLDQVFDRLLLGAIDPSSHGENAELNDEVVHGREGSAAPIHAEWRTQSIAKPTPSGSAEFWYKTGLFGRLPRFVQRPFPQHASQRRRRRRSRTPASSPTRPAQARPSPPPRPPGVTHAHPEASPAVGAIPVTPGPLAVVPTGVTIGSVAAPPVASPTHTPFSHCCPARQGASQSPQCRMFESRSTQDWPQAVSPAAQVIAQTPFEHGDDDYLACIAPGLPRC
jgi:hypothetical protein